MPKIGLVTVLFNSNSVLEGFIKSLSAQTFKDYHLYLVDNTPSAETDRLIAELTAKYPVSEFTHIRNTGNLGVAKGNNQGTELSLAAGCTHTLLLNNDIEIEQADLLERMYNTAIDKQETLIIPKILYYDTRKIWMAGGILQKYRGTNIHVGDKEDDGPAYSKTAHFDYAPTCFMLIANSVFREIGLMDEQYFVYYDDIDWIYRATEKGHMVYLMPDLIVLHKVSSLTGGTESLFSIYYSNRNRVYFLRKNFRGFRRLISLGFTLSTRVIKYFRYAGKEREQLKKAVLEGMSMKTTS